MCDLSRAKSAEQDVLRKLNGQLQLDLEALKTECRDMLRRGEEREREVMQKVCLIVNEKKRKIADLRGRVDELQDILMSLQGLPPLAERKVEPVPQAPQGKTKEEIN